MGGRQSKVEDTKYPTEQTKYPREDRKYPPTKKRANSASEEKTQKNQRVDDIISKKQYGFEEDDFGKADVDKYKTALREEKMVAKPKLSIHGSKVAPVRLFEEDTFATSTSNQESTTTQIMEPKTSMMQEDQYTLKTGLNIYRKQHMVKYFLMNIDMVKMGITKEEEKIALAEEYADIATKEVFHDHVAYVETEAEETANKLLNEKEALQESTQHKESKTDDEECHEATAVVEKEEAAIQQQQQQQQQQAEKEKEGIAPYGEALKKNHNDCHLGFEKWDEVFVGSALHPAIVIGMDKDKVRVSYECYKKEDSLPADKLFKVNLKAGRRTRRAKLVSAYTEVLIEDEDDADYVHMDSGDFSEGEE